MKWLIYGHLGWIGSMFCDFLVNNYPNIKILIPHSRAEDATTVARDLDEMKPERVISFIGRTSGQGCNTIDYLEQDGKLKDNIRDNLYSPIVLMKLCNDRNIHFTYLGTGCIFSYEDPSDKPFTEQSNPNFFGSSYSIVKGYTDLITRLYPNTLNVRIRMPITDKDCPKNFISKIVSYHKIYNSLNSMTVLNDAIPALILEVLNSKTGTINLVNPEPIDHITILELYKKYKDPNHKYELITESEHDSLLLSKRSKNVLTPSLNLPTTISSVDQILRTAFMK